MANISGTSSFFFTDDLLNFKQVEDEKRTVTNDGVSRCGANHTHRKDGGGGHRERVGNFFYWSRMGRKNVFYLFVRVVFRDHRSVEIKL
jgi:hypothetical protein